MWDRLFDNMMDKVVTQGRLTIKGPGRRGTRSFGNGQDAPQVTVHLRDTALPRKLLMSPELALGEAYMDGTLTVEGDDLHGLIALLLQNHDGGENHWAVKLELGLRRIVRSFQQHNPMPKARANVAHHYDLSGKLYDLFLDDDRQYSCAYFPDPGMTLEAAQAAKKHHIARKLLIEPGMRVLDIGCGWGGMALTLARDYGARVLGVTLSKEQHAVASARAEEVGLEGRVEFRLQDYRKVRERFDRIVSVGMFEHVGVPHYREYFDNVHARLSEGGVSLIHTIGRVAPPGATSPWIHRYIFPGGYIPALSEVMRAVERAGLWNSDIEVWRMHYAMTLRHWFDRFVANIDKAEALYDARFCRMWKYYLVISEQSFRYQHHCVFQLQLATERDVVPLTRTYLYEPGAERGRMAAE
ncbi:MAG: cyclopropane-fatty-acyl-phospholipid synthase family protein [Pseudomonadota bacterium]